MLGSAIGLNRSLGALRGAKASSFAKHHRKNLLMSILKKESSLFEEWSVSRSGFVADGVISEIDYLKSKLKLCFVLKEVNDEGGGDWDLREFVRDGARPQTWDNIARWVKCIDNIDTDIPWAFLESINDSQRAELLLSICAMNLKKTPGGSSTNQTELEKVVEEDQSFIRRQYSIYEPDLTICCGTGWDFRYALSLNDGDVLEAKHGIKWFRNHEGRPVIIYRHPQSRIKHSTLAYELVDAIREIIA